jgi:putative AbiEii toxin of type IV toxin-antitoxin system
MPIERMILREFTAFTDAEFEFCPGINVLIGANSTGKTHALKAMYSLVKTFERAHRDSIQDRERLSSLVADKFQGVFKPDAVGRLVRRHRGRGTGEIKLTYDRSEITTAITTLSNVTVDYSHFPTPPRSVYLPVHEFLSVSEGFIAAYTNRETSFDETYFDLSVALTASPLTGQRQAEISDLVTPLEKALGGTITQKLGRFYIKLPEGKLEAHLVAEGYRKLAGLMRLITNGTLTQNGILFWDEPEANLNPNLVTVVVNMLRTLADSGIQMFIATHDYLLSQELSLLAEYEPETVDIRFFALHKPSRRAGVDVETGNSLVEIDNNPILAEFSAHYDREILRFQGAQLEAAE